MARTTIPPAWIDPKEPVRSELIDRLRLNDIDNDSRITNIENQTSKVDVYDCTISGCLKEKTASELQGVLLFRAPQDFNIVQVKVTLLTATTGGNLEIDILKTSNADLSGFSSIFSTKPVVAGNTVGSNNPTVSITPGSEFIEQNDWLRLDITSLKDTEVSFHVSVYGEIAITP